MSEEKLGPFNKKGSRCRIGLKIPAPMGHLWGSMLNKQHSTAGASNSEFGSEDSRHATIIACQMARAVDAYVPTEVKLIEAHRARVRATDHLDGVIAPPKGVAGLYKLHDDERRQRFAHAMVKEIAALTDMGTLSHMHSKAELWEKFKVDLDVAPSVPTLMLFENKIHDGNTNAEDMTAKARMCVEGTRRHMKQGVHYDYVYAAMP